MTIRRNDILNVSGHWLEQTDMPGDVCKDFQFHLQFPGMMRAFRWRCGLPQELRHTLRCAKRMDDKGLRADKMPGGRLLLLC
jgi:hypothetical protein